MPIKTFRSGSSTYKCTICGKLTRDTGEGERSVEQCRKCFIEGGLEVEHQDGYHEDAPMKDCPMCQEEGKFVETGRSKARYEHDDECIICKNEEHDLNERPHVYQE